jgi:hypothetical protein
MEFLDEAHLQPFERYNICTTFEGNRAVTILAVEGFFVTSTSRQRTAWAAAPREPLLALLADYAGMSLRVLFLTLPRDRLWHIRSGTEL